METNWEEEYSKLCDSALRLHELYKNENRQNHEIKKLIYKIKRLIIENCISSNEWTELENHTMIPTGNITYKTMSRKKVEELMEMIRR